jgi:hypothetical protein
MSAGLPEWWGSRHSKRMGNSPTSTFASPSHREWRLHRRRWPPPPPRPAGQTPGLRRPARLPAGPAGRRLEHPPARRPPRHHPAGHPPRDQGLPRPPATPPRAAGAATPTRQRQRAAERAAQQRAAAQVAALGFASVRAYLLDRPVTRAWTLAQVQGELGAAPATLRRLLDQHQVRRVAPTRRQRAAATAANRPARSRGRSVNAARPAWPSSAWPRWTPTCGTGLSSGAGRCGGCAPSLGGPCVDRHAAPPARAARPTWTYRKLGLPGGWLAALGPIGTSRRHSMAAHHARASSSQRGPALSSAVAARWQAPSRGLPPSWRPCDRLLTTRASGRATQAKAQPATSRVWQEGRCHQSIGGITDGTASPILESFAAR